MFGSTGNLWESFKWLLDEVIKVHLLVKKFLSCNTQTKPRKFIEALNSI